MSFTPPLRPERSNRRPINAPSNLYASTNSSPEIDSAEFNGSPRQDEKLSKGGMSKSQRMLKMLNGGTGSSKSRAANKLSFSKRHERITSVDSNFSLRSNSEDERALSPEPVQSPPQAQAEATGSQDLSQSKALASALSAFTSAGHRRDIRRDPRRGIQFQSQQSSPLVGNIDNSGISTPSIQPEEAEEEPEQEQEQEQEPEPEPAPIALPSGFDELPPTPAFAQIKETLLKIQHEWPEILRGTSFAAHQPEEAGEFDPVALALGLLDPSTAGTTRSLAAFVQLKSYLDSTIVSSLATPSIRPTGNNEDPRFANYRAYESAVPTYHSVVSNLTEAQKVVHDLKKRLETIRAGFGAEGDSDGTLRVEGSSQRNWARQEGYVRLNFLEEMDNLLDEIDKLRIVPDRLELLLSEKRFLTAVLLLVRSLKVIRKPELQEIGALTDLRTWLVAQEGVILEMLMEELHNHLYLKSFYCDARWKPYTKGQTVLPSVYFGDDVDNSQTPEDSYRSGRSRAAMPVARQTRLQRYLKDLTLKPSHTPMLDEMVDYQELTKLSTDVTGLEELDEGELSASINGGDKAGSDSNLPKRKNVETDSFSYIESLLESLACLGKICWGIDMIIQRVSSEVFNLVDITVDEVEERNDPKGFLVQRNSVMFGGLAGGRMSGVVHPLSSNNRSSVLRLTASETSELEMNVETMKDLFWTLYSKLDAVLQGFVVVYQVSLRISERRDFKESSQMKTSSSNMMLSLIEVWKPIQQEVRSLLYDYLTDEQSGVISSRNPIVSVNEVLRNGKQRDKTKQMFKFSDSNMRACTKSIKTQEDDLYKALKAAVPGAVIDSNALGSAHLSSLSTDDRFNVERAGLSGIHKTLVKADAFNVSILFSPTWAFLERVRTIMPEGVLGEDNTGEFTGFLEEFVLKTFLPQLQAKVTSVYQNAVDGMEAFQEDANYKRFSTVPIIKCASNMITLVHSLGSMLRATPFHRESYSQLIVSVLLQFFLKCQTRFRELAINEIPNADMYKKSATWAESPDLNQCLRELKQATGSKTELLHAETKRELERKGNAQIPESDLFSHPKKLLALGTLHSSLSWFISQISTSKIKVTPSAAPRMAGNSFAFSETEFGGDIDSRPLPLTEDMVPVFEQLLDTFTQLSDLVLFTLRMEIRLKTIHFLDKAAREGSYQLQEDVTEPDSSIVELNSALAECDDCAASTLKDEDRAFIFEGLSMLMDHLLIYNARHIRLANSFGLSKMMRNILALQQNLKNIGESPLEVNFDRSRQYWELFNVGPEKMIKLIKARKVTYEFEDYKALLNLMCNIDQSAKDEYANGYAGAQASITGSNTADKSRRMYNQYLIDLFSETEEAQFMAI